jgi:RimJ/RimL family protein N-acetyltransferase
VGVVGIDTRSGFRDTGIGTEIVRTLAAQATAMGLKVLTLTAFATNKQAIRVYERNGFVQVGRIPRKHFEEGEYVDEVIMTKLLE